jgi:hypothetical protein
MLTKERPQLPRLVDAVAISPDHPFRRYPLAARPRMAFSLDRVEHHARIVSAVRILEARDTRSDRRFDRMQSRLLDRRWLYLVVAGRADPRCGRPHGGSIPEGESCPHFLRKSLAEYDGVRCGAMINVRVSDTCDDMPENERS